MKPSFALLVSLLALIGCGTPDGMLIVQVRTDLTPNFGFDRIAVSLRGDGVSRDLERLAADATGWGSGVRVAEVRALPPGLYQLTVSALDDGNTIVSRPVNVELDGANRVVTVLLSRDCAAVACPGAGDPSAVACLGGRCVEEGCTEETPELCPEPECTNDDMCSRSSPCAVAECSPSGTCFETPDEGMCAPVEICDITLGCIIAGACVEWERAVTTGGDAGPALGEDLSATDSSVLVVWGEAGVAVWTSPRDARTGIGLAPPTQLTPAGSVPQITPTPEGALVTWREANLWAALVDPSGRPLGDPQSLDALWSGTEHWSAIWTGSGAIVSWTTMGGANLNHAFTDLTSDLGTPFNSVQTTRSLSHVAPSPGEVLVCYEETEPAPGVRCERLDASDARSLGPASSPVGSATSPSTAIGRPGEIGVAWVGEVGIEFHRVTLEGVPIPGSRTRVTDVTGTAAPALAHNGGTFALVYRTTEGGLAYAQFLGGSGDPSTVFRDLPTAGRLTGSPSLIALNGAFYVTYRADMLEAQADVYLRKICP